MNFSKNTKKNFDVILVYALAAVLVFVVFCGCKNNEADSIDVTAPETSKSVVTESVTETEKPDEETSAPDEETTEHPKEMIALGSYKLTAYCGCSKCCGKWGENRPVDSEGKTIVRTAGGYRAEEGVTIAADINVLPYGTTVIIDGHEYIVQDRGGAVNGNHIDIYFENHQDAVNFGVQYRTVYIYSEDADQIIKNSKN